MPIDSRHFARGAVVLTRDQEDQRIGHIEGFTRNAVGEVILSVAWDDDTVTSIHPNHVDINPAYWPKRWPQERCIKEIDQRAAKEAAQREAAALAAKPRSLFRRFFTFAA